MDDLNQIRLDQELTEDQLNKIGMVEEEAKEKEENSERYTDEYVPKKVSPMASFICQRLQLTK